MYALLVPQFIKSLNNANVFFDKGIAHARAKKFDPQILLQMRLSPDQYPFLNQIQIACDHAKGCVARLAGQEPPKHEDTESTFDQLRARTQKVIAYLKTFQTSDLQGCEDKRIYVPYAPDGKYVFGFEYAVEIALPNFYFHLTTAYAILRHAGVELGKSDFLGEIAFKA